MGRAIGLQVIRCALRSESAVVTVTLTVATRFAEIPCRASIRAGCRVPAARLGDWDALPVNLREVVG